MPNAQPNRVSNGKEMQQKSSFPITFATHAKDAFCVHDYRTTDGQSPFDRHQ